MKKLLLFTAILLGIISYSCEESLSSKAPFTEDYILYAVINIDTTFQTAYITTSYNIKGYDPLENKTDPALQGATIKVYVNQTEYVFREAVTNRSDTSRYKTPLKYYVCENFHASGGNRISITATLKNGRVLRSSTTAPFVSNLFFETTTMDYNPALNDRNHPGIEFSWDFFGGNGLTSEVRYFAPRLDLIYSKTDSPDKKTRVEIPLNFIKNGESWYPVYPKVSSGIRAVFLHNAIERILASISEGDAQKSKYIIHEAEFTILLMDKNLASYIAAQNTFRDEFSVRIDAIDFDNIENGIGLFGVYASQKARVKIANWYISSFGYQTSY